MPRHIAHRGRKTGRAGRIKAHVARGFRPGPSKGAKYRRYGIGPIPRKSEDDEKEQEAADE